MISLETSCNLNKPNRPQATKEYSNKAISGKTLHLGLILVHGYMKSSWTLILRG